MVPIPEFFPGITGFQWDEGNSEKNWSRHAVKRVEAEQVFFNVPIFVEGEAKQPEVEKRYFLLGESDSGRLLAVVFVVRGPLVRVISARPMSRRERRLHAQAKGA